MVAMIMCTQMCCCRLGGKTLRSGPRYKERVPGIRCRCSNLDVEVASPAARKSPGPRCSRTLKAWGTGAGRQRKGPTSAHSTGQSSRASFELLNLTQLPAPSTVVIKPRVSTLYSLTSEPKQRRDGVAKPSVSQLVLLSALGGWTSSSAPPCHLQNACSTSKQPG